jgi:hypothetical protein
MQTLKYVDAHVDVLMASHDAPEAHASPARCLLPSASARCQFERPPYPTTTILVQVECSSGARTAGCWEIRGATHCPSRGEYVTATRTLSRVVDRVEAYVFNKSPSGEMNKHALGMTSARCGVTSGSAVCVRFRFGLLHAWVLHDSSLYTKALLRDPPQAPPWLPRPWLDRV